MKSTHLNSRSPIAHKIGAAALFFTMGIQANAQDFIIPDPTSTTVAPFVDYSGSNEGDATHSEKNTPQPFRSEGVENFVIQTSQSHTTKHLPLTRYHQILLTYNNGTETEGAFNASGMITACTLVLEFENETTVPAGSWAILNLDVSKIQTSTDATWVGSVQLKDQTCATGRATLRCTLGSSLFGLLHQPEELNRSVVQYNLGKHLTQP